MMRRINVIHICDKFGVGGSSIHGVSRLFSWWFPRFDKKHFNVSLVGLRTPDEASNHIESQGIKIESLSRSKFDFRTVTDIVKIIKRDKADIIHLHGYGASNFGIMASLSTNVKVVVHEHFVDPSMPFYQVPFDFLLSRFAKAGIAVSESVKDFMFTRRFLPYNRVSVIYNGAPLEEFNIENSFETNGIKQQYGLSSDSIIIGSIGRLGKQKGFEYFIDAASQLCKKRDDCVFVIVGDGPLMNALKSRCIEMRVNDKFIFTGFVSQIQRIQSLFDIQVFSSLWEGTPLTLFEAMAMKRAIVSTTADGLNEVLTQEKTALLVPPGDSNAMTSALERLCKNEDDRNMLRKNAYRERIKYDVAASVRQIESIYYSLVSQNRAG